MATVRKIVFANDHIYHVYNRGIDGRPIFTDKRSCSRFIEIVRYYRHVNTPLRYSKLRDLLPERQVDIWANVLVQPLAIDILSFCLMPNHFHFMLVQKSEGGISQFLANITNSYTRYLNTRKKRIGALFQGTFKAVFVETDEQLLHLSRYIHINPVVSLVVSEAKLEDYSWSSLKTYLGQHPQYWVNSHPVMSHFRNKEDYRKFIYDRISYGKELEKIKHLTLE